MGTGDRYTAEQMRRTLACLAPIFDVVRLVDPRDTAVLTLEEDGTLRREPYQCFRVWDKACRCKNCTSIHSMLGGCQRTKYEFIRDDVFYVVSRPLTLLLAEETPVVLEIVSHVSDQLLLEKEDGKSFAQRLDELQEKLYRDDLTRAFNRRYFSEFTFIHRGLDFLPKKLGLILLDLRQFKQVNDTQGHLAGDRVLEEVARVLSDRVRAQDSVIRLGGDEFVVTLPNCEESVVRRKVEELRAAVAAVAQADFGYACTDAFETSQDFLTRLLDEADRRMYEEKRRNALAR